MCRRGRALKAVVGRTPAWLPTALCMLAILWLTLAPSPTGSVDVPLFEGADKVAHAIMFGALAYVACFDLWRCRGVRPLRSWMPWAMASASTVVGVVIECAQHAMGLGRSFDMLDIAADLAGAMAAAVVVALLPFRLDVAKP